MSLSASTTQMLRWLRILSDQKATQIWKAFESFGNGVETLYSMPGQDEGGGCQDDPGNKGRRGDQVQQVARGSKTRWYTLHIQEKNSTWFCLKYPSLSCCSTRQNAGSHPEEGETQDGESYIADKYKYKYSNTDANTNTNVKVKHKMVENMTSSTADALGLSRAILCNDRWNSSWYSRVMFYTAYEANIHKKNKCTQFDQKAGRVGKDRRDVPWSSRSHQVWMFFYLQTLGPMPPSGRRT